MLTEEEIRGILADRRKYLEAYVNTHFYDQAHDEQVIIRTLKIVLEDIDKDGMPKEEKE